MAGVKGVKGTYWSRNNLMLRIQWPWNGQMVMHVEAIGSVLEMSRTQLRELAAKRAAALYLERREGLPPPKLRVVPPRPLTFEELVERYEEEVCPTLKSCKDRVRHVRSWAEFLGPRTLDEVSAFDVERYKRERSEQVQKPTVNREFAALKHLFNTAIRWGFTERCETLRPLIEAGLSTGCRSGELCHLRWEHVDKPRQGSIYIPKSKSGKARFIPIGSRLRRVLDEMKTANHDRAGYVFPYQDRFGYRSAFSAAPRRAGTKDLRFHDLRHSFASRLAMAGVDLVTIKEVLGHQSLAMVQRYSHLAEEHKRKAIEAVEASSGVCSGTASKTASKALFSEVEAEKQGEKISDSKHLGR